MHHHGSEQSLDYYKSNFRSQERKLLEEYLTFLRFPSISADPARREDLRLCADWLVKEISDSPMEVEVWNQDDAPIIFASYMEAGPKQPTLLIYNHYDVQPVDPIDLWHNDPFKPTKVGNLIYARGAQDNKGQCFYVLSALKLYLRHRKMLPINIKWIIEGEEEFGSQALSRLVKEKAQKLECDYLLIVDLAMRDQNHPAITLGTRGITTMEVDVKATKGDLHSGSHGGLAYNPLHALSEILSSLRDKRGVIQVPGFYDDVTTPKAEELAKINFAFSAEDYKDQFGALPTGGEKGFSPLERNWLRPTLEINGIGGGYQGPGGKTVIPALAHAKLSCRLVPNQEPKHIASLVKNYIEAQAPEGVEVAVTIHEGMGKPVRTSLDSGIIKALEAACIAVWRKHPEYILEGASIPVVSDFKEHLKGEIGMFGVGLPSDNIHAPNECFGWDRMELGFLTISKLIDALAT